MSTRRARTGESKRIRAVPGVGDSHCIRQKVLIPAGTRDVYDAFLDAGIHSAFTGAAATCERWVGGKFTAWDGYISGKNLKLESGQRIVQEWKTTEWPRGFPPSILELVLKPRGGRTDVHLTQKQVPPSQSKQYKRGWKEFYWNPLKRYFSSK